MERTWLVFRLGPCVMCASALDVEGIIQRPPVIVKFPAMPDYALGAFLFRDRSAAAISLRRKLRMQHGEDRATGPFIVTRIRDAVVAFWVDEVRDVIEDKDADWRPMPALLEGGLFARFAIRERELILQTSFAALLDAKVEFESFAAWAAAHADERAAPAAPVATPVSVAPIEVTPQTLPSQPDPAPTQQAARLSHPPKVRSRIEVARKAPTRAARATPAIPIATAPLRADARAATPPKIAGSERRASPLRYRFAAAGVAIAALAAILYGVLPGSLRDTSPVPVSSASLGSPPEREQIASTRSAAPSPALENPPEEAAASRARVYVVVRGDTLWDIAKKHVGDGSQYPELAKLSSIRNPDLIHPGDRVRIEIRR